VPLSEAPLLWGASKEFDVMTNTIETSTDTAGQEDPIPRPLSISQLQLWYRCGYAWYLR
jgi:hypothetical protein